MMNTDTPTSSSCGLVSVGPAAFCPPVLKLKVARQLSRLEGGETKSRETSFACGIRHVPPLPGDNCFPEKDPKDRDFETRQKLEKKWRRRVARE